MRSAAARRGWVGATAVALFVLAACANMTDDSGGASCLAVTVPHGVTTISLGRLTLRNSIIDPAGLAGLEVAVRWDADTVTLGSDHLPSGCFAVPESGLVFVDVTLSQAGELVSEGTAYWGLLPNSEWEVAVDRAPSPMDAGIDPRWPDEPNPKACSWFWCHGVWGFKIRSDARHYEEEVLWLTIWRVVPGECVDIC